MIVSPSAVNIPLIATSVNVPTEQVARDNKVREPVAAPTSLDRTNAERQINEDDKRRKQSAWDPSEHPDYEHEEAEEEQVWYDDDSLDGMERLFRLLSLDSYSQSQGKGYIVRFRLPQHILDAALKEGQMVQRRHVIKYHYDEAVAPNIPSGVLAVL
ncbi:ATP-dependent Lon protease [Vibrio sp. 10N.286.49.B3]|uniref:ATP-dependent Lon protease n=1 Tax=Vibrio sp. 10N.286.49.B3 TaxID=1880855 RepID=UPI000C830925|nr:ATP-dependent Lon protease [Vibrio sp. 10N.286.49.B3]PMH46021.1 ATP-dependent Lon protease [Vibrio sp. 10N.286.49.B3]